MSEALLATKSLRQCMQPGFHPNVFSCIAQRACGRRTLSALEGGKPATVGDGQLGILDGSSVYTIKWPVFSSVVLKSPLLTIALASHRMIKYQMAIASHRPCSALFHIPLEVHEATCGLSAAPCQANMTQPQKCQTRFSTFPQQCHWSLHDGKGHKWGRICPLMSWDNTSFVWLYSWDDNLQNKFISAENKSAIIDHPCFHLCGAVFKMLLFCFVKI